MQENRNKDTIKKSVLGINRSFPRLTLHMHHFAGNRWLVAGKTLNFLRFGSVWTDHIPVTAEQNRCVQSKPDRGTETLHKTVMLPVRVAFGRDETKLACSAVQWDSVGFFPYRFSSAVSCQICRLNQGENVGTSGTVLRVEGGD